MDGIYGLEKREESRMREKLMVCPRMPGNLKLVCPGREDTLKGKDLIQMKKMMD